MMRLLWVITFSPVLVAARLPVYSPCNIANNHLQPNTKEFVSDCDVYGCELGAELLTPAQAGQRLGQTR